MKLKILVGLLLAIGGISSAMAQTAGSITFGANVTTGNGTVTPVLTWSTAPAAQSCVASGGWSGTKTAAGTETLAAISTSATYNITCTWAAKNSVTLTWVPPTQNTDGSVLTDLKGFKLYSGSNVGNLVMVKDITTPATTSYVVSGLATGPWYFQMTAYNTVNNESVKAPNTPVMIALSSTQGTKSVGIQVNPVPMAPTNLTVE